MKIYKLLDIIQKYDYVFTSDADVIITNRDIRIEDIIFEFMKEKHNLLITTDFNSINSGNIIWKNCEKSIILLNEIIKTGNNKIRYSIKKPDEYIKSNIIGSYNLLNLIKNLKIKHFLFASTSSVYGNSKSKKFDESMPCNSPISLYSATKKSIERETVTDGEQIIDRLRQVESMIFTMFI